MTNLSADLRQILAGPALSHFIDCSSNAVVTTVTEALFAAAMHYVNSTNGRVLFLTPSNKRLYSCTKMQCRAATDSDPSLESLERIELRYASNIHQARLVLGSIHLSPRTSPEDIFSVLIIDAVSEYFARPQLQPETSEMAAAREAADELALAKTVAFAVEAQDYLNCRMILSANITTTRRRDVIERLITHHIKV